MGDLIRFDPKDKRYIDLPVNYHEMPTRQAQIHWLEDLGEKYFLAGCEFSGGEMTQWVLELTEAGFQPMFNALTVSIEDLIERAKRLKAKEVKESE